MQVLDSILLAVIFGCVVYAIIMFLTTRGDK